MIDIRLPLTKYRRKPILYFVYAMKYKNYGSTIMRGEQLSNIVSSYSNIETSFLPISTKFKNSTLLLTKGVMLDIGQEYLEILLKKNNRLIFDPVDLPVPDYITRYATVLIAASRSAYREYTTKFPNSRVVIVDHHADPRIPKKISKYHNTFEVGYFGEPQNTVITKGISDIVDIIPTPTAYKDDAWLQKTGNYSLHYAIRKQQSFDGFKPFTKGFTAARCGANILTQRDYESEFWLGKDYPYLIDYNSNEKEIINALNLAKNTFQTNRWYRAIEVMEELQVKVSAKNIAQQVVNMIESI